MTAAEYVVQVVAAMERLGIPFMVVGSMSSNIYGIPRSQSIKDAFPLERGLKSNQIIAGGDFNAPGFEV